MDRLEIICCYFNPQGYRNLKRNFFEFRQRLNAPLTTVELSFSDHFVIHDAIQISGSDRHLMWQKERLLNIAIQQSDTDAVAWVDADLIFENEDWIAETLQKLEQHPVVQLFESVVDLDSRRQPIRESHGDAYVNTHGIKVYGRPGGAWAARREVLGDGLIDHHVLGGGDAMQLAAWRGNWKHSLMKALSPEWKRFHLRCGAKSYPLVRNSIGYTSGRVRHLYHGSRRNRKYVERWRYLSDHAFDPSEDIAVDSNGLWMWNSDKPEMHEKVRHYFSERREDE